MADVPSTSSRKTKRRKKNAKSKVSVPAPSPPPTKVAVTTSASTMSEVLEETCFWYNGGTDETSQSLAAMKLEVLGPFLFSRGILCDEAVQVARKNNLLSKDSNVWPMFFQKSWWSRITQITGVMSAVVGLCEKDHHVYEHLFNDDTMDSMSLVKRLRKTCRDQLSNITDDYMSHVCTIVVIQGANFYHRAKENKNLAVGFFHGLTDKVKLVDPVKDRGNSNFKQMRFKAAIADYSTAIKLCPFSPVLYCNRALCYLRNEDYWNACVDSYRALVLYPTWEKPYYRCAEAWHRLGEISFAIDINRQGQQLASSCTDLQSQLSSFIGSDASSDNTRIRDPKSEDGKTAGKTVKDKPAGASTGSVKTKTLTKKEYTEFEKLQCPELDSRISCAELRKLCNAVKLEWCSPASYFSVAGHQSQWEELEPTWLVPISPSTDPLAEREPMMAKFDEIWCPVLADVEDSFIIPPTFQYFSDGTVMHSAIY